MNLHPLNADPTFVSPHPLEGLGAPASGPLQYDNLQRAFHWSMAAIIFVAIALGIWAFNLERGSELKRFLLFIHKSLGLTVLILVMLRLA